MTLLGVDVSHFQGTVNWPRAKAAGVAFGIAKATESDNFVDPQFKTNIAGMRSAGVVPGAYHFLRPSNAAGQADRFCSVAPADVIHALDVEASNLDVAGWVRRYRVHYPTKTLLIYTGRDLWARAGGGNGAELGPLWAAGYVANRYLPGGPLETVAAALTIHMRGSCPFAGWDGPLFLQFTDAASVPGISGPCDGDVFYGTQAELLALTSANPTASLEDPDMAEPIKLTSQYQVDIYNSLLPANDNRRKKVGDSVSALEVEYWGNLGELRNYLRLQQANAKLDAQATQLATITGAVQALAANSAPEIQEAFAKGIADLEAQLEQIHLVVTTGGQ